ncbi:MAG: hypothetical protein ACREMA_14750 [Longimicrobiales bacterium]
MFPQRERNATHPGLGIEHWGYGHANADEIADFLSGASPANWPRATLRSEMRHHLDLTLQEAQARLRGDWAADIAAYDAIHGHILRMADVLSKGIISQFPQRFS